jgi:hypothetical protein
MAQFLYKHRRGTTSDWNNKGDEIIPLEGEIVIEIDTVENLHKLKIGDGVHTYSELKYLTAGDEIVSQVLAEVKPRVVNINLTTEWLPETDGKYKQTITLDGITAHSRLDLQPTADMLAEFKQLGLVFVTENNSGVITIYSVGNMPLKSYTIQATIVETECVNLEDPVVGIPVGAPIPQPDWNQTDDTKADYIKNKPSVVQTTGDSETDIMSQKSVTDTIIKYTSDIDNRVSFLELVNEGNTYTYITDDTVAYTKNIPTSALPYATLDMVGGMSSVFEDGLQNELNGNLSFLPAVEQSGVTITYLGDDEDGAAKININGTGNSMNSMTVVTIPIHIPFVIGEGMFGEAEVISGHIQDLEFPEYEPICCIYFVTDTGEILNDIQLPQYEGLSNVSMFSSDDRQIAQMQIYVDHMLFDNYTFRIKIGKKKLTMQHTVPTAIKVQGKNLFPAAFNNIGTWTPVSLGSGNDKYIYYLDLPFDGEYTISGTNGNKKNVTYFYLYESNDGFVTNSVKHIFPTYGFPFTFTKKAGYEYRLRWYESASARLAKMQSLQLEYGSTATEYAPYTETIHEIPEAVQSLEGYGLGISADLCNYIDFEKSIFVRMVASRAWQEGDVNGDTMITDGVTTVYALATAEIIDISSMMDFDDFIEVEGKGWIYAENENKKAVPNSITYQIKINNTEV